MLQLLSKGIYLLHSIVQLFYFGVIFTLKTVLFFIKSLELKQHQNVVRLNHALHGEAEF